jgi:4-alpha-glucanotransferase
LGCGELLDLIPLIDWAKEAGLKLIQLLPINDTTITKGEKDSYPYAILSAYALHPIYLNIQKIGPELTEAVHTEFHPRLDYEEVYHTKLKLLKTLFEKRGEKDLASKTFATFFARQKEHLIPYAAFCVLRDRFQTANFKKWKEEAQYSELLAEEIASGEEAKWYFFLQYHLDKQMREVASYAKSKGVLLKGDFPIGVHPHSVEAWRFAEYFSNVKSLGAPPDFYNTVGQNWGFPAYQWEEIEADNFYWLTSRLKWMEPYFGACRIDHVLGYFRLWEIPKGRHRGLMGTFSPAIGYESIPEEKRLTMPFDKSQKHAEEDVCFFKRRGAFHPRIDCKSTKSFQTLSADLQCQVLALHDEYYLERQEEIWEKEGHKKLKAMKNATSMTLCAEDIGVIPNCTAEVLKELHLLDLHVQRMPKSFEKEYEDPDDFPVDCVCTPSNHDTATLRQWWEEDPKSTERYYHSILRKRGDPPKVLTDDLAKEIIQAHLDSKAKWAIFLLQDLFAMSEEIRFPNPIEQRINDPAAKDGQWTWRMHLYIEELLLARSFTKMIKSMVEGGRR